MLSVRFHSPRIHGSDATGNVNLFGKNDLTVQAVSAGGDATGRLPAGIRPSPVLSSRTPGPVTLSATAGRSHWTAQTGSPGRGAGRGRRSIPLAVRRPISSRAYSGGAIRSTAGATLTLGGEIRTEGGSGTGNWGAGGRGGHGGFINLEAASIRVSGSPSSRVGAGRDGIEGGSGAGAVVTAG